MNEMVEAAPVATPVVGSIMVMEDVLNFDPFLCDTVEEVTAKYAAILQALNRGNLYYAWSVGRFVEDTNKLKRQFNINSLKEAADLFHVSPHTLAKYRAVKAMLTPNQVVSLANRAVSINAIIEVGRVADTHPEEGKLIMDCILSGDPITAADVSSILADRIAQRRLPHNLFPGGEAPDGAEEELDPLLLTNETEEPTPAEDILEWSDEGDDTKDTEIEEGDNDYADSNSDSRDTTTKDDGEDSLNKRDIKAVMHNVRNSVAPLRRAFNMLNAELTAQLDVIFDREGIILGDDEQYNEYTDLMEELYQVMQTATETLAVEIERGQEHGYIKRPCVLPESTEISKLFRNEDG